MVLEFQERPWPHTGQGSRVLDIYILGRKLVIHLCCWRENPECLTVLLSLILTMFVNESKRTMRTRILCVSVCLCVCESVCLCVCVNLKESTYWKDLEFNIFEVIKLTFSFFVYVLFQRRPRSLKILYNVIWSALPPSCQTHLLFLTYSNFFFFFQSLMCTVHVCQEQLEHVPLTRGSILKKTNSFSSRNLQLPDAPQVRVRQPEYLLFLCWNCMWLEVE